jgi:hypothetical protein
MICCGRNPKKAGMSVPSDRKDIRQENRTGFPALIVYVMGMQWEPFPSLFFSQDNFSQK